MRMYITDQDYGTAAQNGINHKNVRQRVYDYGWSVEKAITTPIKKMNDRSQWVALAKKNSISRSTLYTRIHLGWDIERAATEPVISKAERLREIAERKRKVPKSLIEKAEQNGIKRGTLAVRLWKGWEPEKAATHPTMTKSEAGSITKSGWGKVNL